MSPSSLINEIELAKAEVQRFEREFQQSRAKYQKLREKLKGPFTLEMIVAEARYRRVWKELREAKYRLGILVAREKIRKKRARVGV